MFPHFSHESTVVPAAFLFFRVPMETTPATCQSNVYRALHADHLQPVSAAFTPLSPRSTATFSPQPSPSWWQASLTAWTAGLPAWTGSTSTFGMELDSLCDMVAFGVAPAVLAYLWALDALWPLRLAGRLPLCGRHGPAAGPVQCPGDRQCRLREQCRPQRFHRPPLPGGRRNDRHLGHVQHPRVQNPRIPFST